MSESINPDILKASEEARDAMRELGLDVGDPEECAEPDSCYIYYRRDTKNDSIVVCKGDDCRIQYCYISGGLSWDPATDSIALKRDAIPFDTLEGLLEYLKQQ